MFSFSFWYLTLYNGEGDCFTTPIIATASYSPNPSTWSRDCCLAGTYAASASLLGDFL